MSFWMMVIRKREARSDVFVVSEELACSEGAITYLEFVMGR